MDFNYNKTVAICFYVLMVLTAIFFFGGEAFRKEYNERIDITINKRDIDLVKQEIDVSVGQASNMLVVMKRSDVFSDREIDDFEGIIERTRNNLDDFYYRFRSYENMMEMARKLHNNNSAYLAPEERALMAYAIDNITASERVIRRSDYHAKVLSLNANYNNFLINMICRVRGINLLPTFTATAV